MNRSTARKTRRILNEHFGFTDLRPGQKEVIDHILAGRDTLAIMPTGSGKSLCYQLPALCESGVTVVVSPLIALMQDQEEKLDELGVHTAVFNSATPAALLREHLENASQPRNSVAMTTPEQLSDEDMINWLKEQEVSLFVVDEAHCISQWGHDFRPAFLDIPTAIRELGFPPVLALTATATDEVIHDIGEQLGLRAMCVIKTGVYRENLNYSVRQVSGEEGRREALLNMLNETEGPAIVYTATVKAATTLHSAFSEAGLSATLYHGRLSKRTRTEHQDAFMSGRVRIMVATNAFGMGIDKPDVRLVVHAQIAGSLDAYYQESGRAGRDGDPARCELIHEEKDRRIQQFFLINRYPTDSCRHARDAEMLEHQLQEKTVGMPKSEPLPGFTVGDRVAVRRRGAGVVEAVTRERVDIRFPDGSLRRFLPHYVRRLKHQPGPPPQEQAA